jgi:hypothetical protein
MSTCRTRGGEPASQHSIVTGGADAHEDPAQSPAAASLNVRHLHKTAAALAGHMSSSAALGWAILLARWSTAPSTAACDADTPLRTQIAVALYLIFDWNWEPACHAEACLLEHGWLCTDPVGMLCQQGIQSAGEAGRVWASTVH